MAQPISVELLEQLVFGKVYFDSRGLILAHDDGRPVGFVHAGFGPNEARDRLSTGVGVTCVVVVRPDCDEVKVAEGLLERSEAYLLGHGAKVLYGGGVAPWDPFYLGLYGGSELPGVLDSDRLTQQLYRTHGYEEVDRTLAFRCRLADFRPIVDRQQMLMRRQMVVSMEADPPARDWWEARAAADFDYTRFELVPRSGHGRVACATFRSMELYASNLESTLGLIDIEVEPPHRRQGAAAFLLGEALRQLSRQGTLVVEAQTTEQNPPCVGLLEKLGLSKVAQGSVFRKRVEGF
jgi:GNAT superfamily N-acetyltransferase